MILIGYTFPKGAAEQVCLDVRIKNLDKMENQGITFEPTMQAINQKAITDGKPTARTPAEHLAQRIDELWSYSDACGYKSCRHVVFGKPPHPLAPTAEKQAFERMKENHYRIAGHKRHLLRHIKEE